MATATAHTGFIDSTAQSQPKPERPSLLRRLFDAMMLSRQHQTDRDLDRLVSWHDGNFTDSLEREIAERSYNDGWGFRR